MLQEKKLNHQSPMFWEKNLPLSPSISEGIKRKEVSQIRVKKVSLGGGGMVSLSLSLKRERRG